MLALPQEMESTAITCPFRTVTVKSRRNHFSLCKLKMSNAGAKCSYKAQQSVKINHLNPGKLVSRIPW